MIRILHLEDDSRDAEQTRRLLSKSDLKFEVRVVDTRGEFIRALTDFNPEIIISDHSLPAFNSIDALNILKSSGQRVPFILLTGAVSEEFAVDAMREGADDYILKDRPHRLPMAVTALLEKFRLEREQKRIENLLRNIDTNSLDVICSLDENGNFLHVSAAAYPVWGYSASELEGRNYLDLIHPDDKEITLVAAQDVRAGNPVTVFENRHVRKDGTIIPMLWSARWEENDHTFYGIARDAREKKMAERALMEQQQRFVGVLQEALAGICILSGPDYTFDFCNPRFESMTERTNLPGKNFRDAFPELAAQGFINLLDETCKTRKVVSRKAVHVRFAGKDEGTFKEMFITFVLHPFAARESKTDSVFVFCLDVTSEIQGRVEIEESRAQYMHLLEHLPVAVFSCNEEGRIQVYNKAAEALWGQTPEPGKAQWCGSCMTFDTGMERVEQNCCPVAKTVNEGIAHLGEELVIERPDGSRRHVVPHSHPTYNAKGELTGAINVMVDITERKKAEFETHILVKKLRLRNKELRQFAYMISHNLRTPIARIMGLADIMGEDDTENKMIVQKIAAETAHVDEVVRDINLILSARDNLKQTEVVVLEEKVKHILQILEEEIRESGASLTTNFHGIKSIITLRGYLYSILINLISNAIKYRHPDRQPCIHLSVRERDNEVILSVKDNGMGIDLSRNGNKIFGLYQRFHGDHFPGRGLGLHLVKTHVETMGGEIEIESEVNEGTEFRVILPNNYEQTTA